MIDFRGGGITCENLIQNGDFENLSCTSPILFPGVQLFQLGCVDSWECLAGSPDMAGPGLDINVLEVPSWPGLSFDNNHAFLCIGTAQATTGPANHREGITQNLNIPLVGCNDECSNTVRYELCFDLSSTPFSSTNGDNGNLTVNLVLGGVGMSTCGAADLHPSIHSWAPTMVHPKFSKECYKFKTGGVFSNLGFQAVSEIGTLSDFTREGAFVDNVHLSCTSDDIKSIIANQSGSCTFDFAPEIANNLAITGISWDFGDGNGSTDDFPTHSYSQDGTYLVSMTVSDVRGCCTTIQTAVTCGVSPCMYYVCWEDMQPMRFAERVIIDGVPHEFQGDILVEGGYDAIKNELFEIFNDPFFPGDPGIFSEGHVDYPCFKENEAGSSPTPGCFFFNSTVEFAAFQGYHPDLGSVTIPFESVNCN